MKIHRGALVLWSVAASGVAAGAAMTTTTKTTNRGGISDWKDHDSTGAHIADPQEVEGDELDMFVRDVLFHATVGNQTESDSTMTMIKVDLENHEEEKEDEDEVVETSGAHVGINVSLVNEAGYGDDPHDEARVDEKEDTDDLMEIGGGRVGNDVSMEEDLLDKVEENKDDVGGRMEPNGAREGARTGIDPLVENLEAEDVQIDDAGEMEAMQAGRPHEEDNEGVVGTGGARVGMDASKTRVEVADVKDIKNAGEDDDAKDKESSGDEEAVLGTNASDSVASETDGTEGGEENDNGTDRNSL